MATVRLSIFVSDIDAIIQSYNVVKIRRSTTGEVGPYSDVTSASKTSASLTSLESTPFSVVGKTLSLKVDHGEQVDVLFTGAGTLSVDQAAEQINAQIPGLASDSSGYLKLESSEEGSLSVVEVVGGSAATEFGWDDGDRSVGREQHITLIGGQSDYTFLDQDGEAEYYYEAAYFNTTTNLQSAWSSPFRGSTGTVISSENLSTATVDLVDATGAAVDGQRISFYSQLEPLEVEGYQASLVGTPVTIETDTTGHAEVTLIRGLRLRVVFEGTSLIREFTVPDSSSFDLLSLMAAAPDPFSPVEPDIPYAIRRTP